MTGYLAFKYLHLLSLFIMVGCVVSQQFMIGREMSGKAIRLISITDLIYGYDDAGRLMTKTYPDDSTGHKSRMLCLMSCVLGFESDLKHEVQMVQGLADGG